MRHESMRNEDENVAQTTASDLRAVAQDMLRMGRHWALAAQGWLERAGDQAQRQMRARSDRDLQSDYSGDGYDQVGAARHGYETYPGGRDFGGRDYRGVGPRNYTRSDERIREDLNERLTEAYDLDASGLTVEVADGVATLGGNVPQRWMKHRAEDLADACIGVRDVRNHILVGSGTASGETTRGSTIRGTTGSAGTTTGQAGSTGKETP
jgi:hypothetical protein